MTQTKLKAALLVAEGKLTEEAIAAHCGITSRGLRKWKHQVEFNAEVARQRQAIRAELDAWRDRVAHLDIVDRSKRLARLDSDQKALDQIREERAADPTLSKLPGGKTGLVIIRRVRTIEIVSKDQKGNAVTRKQTLVMHETDSRLLERSLAINDRVAELLGEKVDKVEHSGPNGGAITIELLDGILSDDPAVRDAGKDSKKS